MNTDQSGSGSGTTAGHSLGSDGGAANGSAGSGIPIGMDRSKAFRQARRHTWFVRALKLLFPLGALGLVGGYGFIFSINQSAVGPRGPKFEFRELELTKAGPAMINPKYEGYNKDGSKFLVTAKRAIPDLLKPDKVTLHDIDGMLTQPDAVRTRLVATRGFFDNEKGELDLFERINIVSETGMRAQLSSAKVFIKQNRIVTTQPLAAQMEAGSIRANAMEAFTKKREAFFTEGVAVKLLPKAAKPAGGNAKAAKSKSAGLGGNSNAPVDVAAMTLHVDDAKKVATFKQNVTASQDGSTLTAQVLEVYYEGDAQEPGSAPKAGAGKPATKPTGTRLKLIKALDGVRMRGADGRSAMSDSATFDAVADTTLMVGAVVLRQGANIVKGGRLYLDRKADTALLTGNVQLDQGRNKLRGGRLQVDRKRATSRLDSPAVGRRKAGRISALFYQQQKPGAGARKPKAAASKGGIPSGVSFKTDPNAPIEIEADRLDVDDKAKTATFSGAVDAKKGGMTIRTVKLIATYSGGTGLGLDGTDLGASGRAGSKSKTPAQLTRVQALEKVLIQATDGQSASGDRGDFDIKANTVTLTGNVTLKRGNSAIVGEKLTIDMTSGQTRIVPRKGVASASAVRQGSSKAPNPAGRPCPPGRTCLQVIPGEFGAFGSQDKAKPGKKSRLGGTSKRRKRRNGGTDGWSSSTFQGG